MKQEEHFSRSFWLTLITFTFIVNLVAAWWTLSRAAEAGIVLSRSIWGGMLLIYFAILLVSIWLFVRMARFGDLPFNISLRFKNLHFDHFLWRASGLILFLAVLFLIPYLKFVNEIGQTVKRPVYDPGMILILYYWACWWVILLAMAALKVALKATWPGAFASALVLLGVTYEVLLRWNAVTAYPLSMGWSEGSRYYYASLYFSKWIYGEAFPLSTLHPSRYLLQSFPFLFPSLGLAAHRFWQFLLWIGLTAAAAFVLSRRVVLPQEKALRWLLTGWYFLFLLRVGVYYHLQLMVIIPLLFVSVKHPWRSLLAVVVASAWAGISRVNWFPVPAMLAIVMYLFETPLPKTSAAGSLKHLASYISKPVLWMVAGLGSALIAQAAYIPLSGNANNLEAFASSFSSALLWYRLWPNESYSLGVVLGILIVSGPLLAILFAAFRQWKSLHPLRWLGILAIIVVLFAGSLVVSTKIGGGGDLHNMDAYAVVIGTVAAYLISGSIQVEEGTAPLKIQSQPIFVTALVMPMLFLIPLLSPYPKFDENKNEAAHQQLVQVVNEIGQTGPVLFINERQLIALGDVNVPLVPDYEVVTLMEMAMSGNEPYLDKFYSDLSNQRFAAIITTRQNRVIKRDGPLFEENNVWNSRIAPYILCSYHPDLTVEANASRIEVYVPDLDASDCP